MGKTLLFVNDPNHYKGRLEAKNYNEYVNYGHESN